MTVVGEAFVQIMPLTTGFSESLKAQVAKATEAATAENAAMFDGLTKSAEDTGDKMAESLAGVGLAGGKMSEDVEKSLKDVEGRSGETGNVLDRFSSRVSSSFEKAGATLGNWGIPFSGSLDNMAKKIDGSKTSTGGLLTTLGSIGKMATVAGVGGFAVIGAASVKMASDFEAASTHLVTDAGESQSALSSVEQGMLAISSATGTSAASIVDGMYHIESSGVHGQAALEILRTAAEGAKVGGADLDTVTKTLMGTMKAFNLPASDSVKVMNEMIATVGSGDMRMQDLASSFGNVTSVAAKAGLSIAQVGGAVATMTARGISTNQATQDLANTIRSLQNPTSVATTEMAQMGLNSNTVASQLGKLGLTGTLNELVDAITSHMGPAGTVLLDTFNQSQTAAGDLKQELAAMPANVRTVATAFEAGHLSVAGLRTEMKAMPATQAAMLTGFESTFNVTHKFNAALTAGGPAAQTFNAALAKMTGGATGLQTTLQLTGGNAADFATNVKAIQSAADHTGRSVNNWNTIQGTFSQQMDVAKTTVENLGIKLGMVLIPKIEGVISVTREVIQWFVEHKAAAEVLAGVIGGLLATTIAIFVVQSTIAFGKWVRDGVKAFADQSMAAARWLIGQTTMFAQWAAEQATSVAESTALWAMYASEWLSQQLSAMTTFMAEHAAMAASFIAENTTMIASATAAFIAENAATLGIVAALAVLVGAIVYAATHWHQVWGDIKAVAEDAWHFLDGVWQSIDADIRSIWGDIEHFFEQWWPLILGVFTGGIGLIVGLVIQHWTQVEQTTSSVWNAITSFLSGAWSTITGDVSTAVSRVEGFFSGLWDTITGGVSAGISTLVGDFEALPRKVLNAVDGLLTDMLHFGEQIASNILNGLGNIGSEIASKLTFGLLGGGAAAGTYKAPTVGHSFSGPGRADGGPVWAGQQFVVGERGPEIVQFAGPGYVIPNHRLKAASYDSGGFLPPGLSLAYNGTGAPEPVGQAAGGGGGVYIAPGAVVVTLTIGSDVAGTSGEIESAVEAGVTSALEKTVSLISGGSGY